MQLSQLFTTALCMLFRCEYEYPSDPLAHQRTFTRAIAGNSRAFNFNEVQTGRSDPIVRTRAGILEGYIMKTIKGRPLAAFEGIPYGEDTGRPNRFMPPVRKRSWTGIRSAKAVGSKCMQLHLFHAFQLVGSEDCLFLNVYTPQIPTRRKHPNLPVLVFVHGGSWYFGGGSEYGPAYLLEHDIILVTLNYRLGIFGFLSTGDEVIPGNLGLKDQALALQWVQENIKAFGGNPKNVTLMGQSSGAASVHLHMMSKMSRGTFAKAIALSGSAFSSWSIMNKKVIARRNWKLARASRCPQKPSKAFKECLNRMSGRQLGRLFYRLYELPLVPTVPLAAVIEPNIPGAFLSSHPDEIYARGEVAAVPFICSRNLNETEAVFTAFRTFGLSQSSPISLSLWKIFAPIFMDYQLVAADRNLITEKIVNFYTKKSNLPSNASIYAEAASDRIFGYGVHKSLQLHSQVAQTYSWVYGYAGRSSLVGSFGGDPSKFGISHTDDLPIYFNMSEFYVGYKTTDPEFAVVKLITSLIANFVSKGKPLYTDGRGNDLKIWDPITDPRNMRVLSITKEVKMIPEPLQERYKFWESLGLPDIQPFIPIQ